MSSPVVQESIVRDFEKPGPELTAVYVSVYGKVCLHQGFLSYIIGIGHVTCTQSQQIASEGILVDLYMRYELVACHACSWVSCFSSASISLASNFLPTR